MQAKWSSVFINALARAPRDQKSSHKSNIEKAQIDRIYILDNEKRMLIPLEKQLQVIRCISNSAREYAFFYLSPSSKRQYCRFYGFAVVPCHRTIFGHRTIFHLLVKNGPMTWDKFCRNRPSKITFLRKKLSAYIYYQKMPAKFAGSFPRSKCLQTFPAF